MSKSSFYLVTGYLGSGKTSFLKHIIGNFAGEQRIAVIQNEFAPANIDGNELKKITHKHFDILEVNNGSVFCVCLLSGFVKSLKSFVGQYRPEIIFMEASGLSDPVSIGQIFNSPDLQTDIYLAGVICIIDAVNFLKMHVVMQQIAHQIMIADFILINKSDLFSSTDEIELSIRKHNPLAQIFKTVDGKVPIDEVFSSKTEGKPKTFFFLQSTSNRPDIQSVVLKTSKPLNSKNLQIFIDCMVKNCYRLKGIILLDNQKVISVQQVADDFRMEEINSVSMQTEIIAIGNEITTHLLKTAYEGSPVR